MKVIVNEDRKIKVACMNKSGTQNENKATELELQVPTEFEDYNKKIVFVTDDGTVWDIITNNEYKITNAITKYKQVDFYIWLTKEVDGESIDFRTKTKTLSFYHNEDASDEITDEEIHGVNTVVNLLEEEIEKVENLNIEATKIGSTTTVTITKKDGTTESVEINDGVDGQDGQDGYTPQKGIDYFTEQDIEEIETDVKEDILEEVYTKEQTNTLLEEKADVEDIPDVSNFITKDVNNLTNYTLKTNTGSLIDLEINDTTYVVTLKLKNQDGTIISTDTIDLPLESVVVSGRYDNTTKKVILTLENGSEVDFSVADLVAGLQTEITSQNKLASDLVDDTNSGNKFVTTSEKQTWNNKLDESDLTDYVKNTDYATNQKGGVIKVNNPQGTAMYSSGIMYALTRDYNTYQNDSNGTFIGKGTLENVITGKGLVKDTDYATNSKGGVIRTSSYYGNTMTNDGFLSGQGKTYQDYTNGTNSLIIAKQTLENVITGKQLINQTQLEESQESQDEQIARLKATLPTTTGEGQDITLNKTAEMEFVKPPLPRGNTKQDTTTGKNLLNTSNANTTTVNGVTSYRNNGFYYLSGTNTKTDATWILPNTQNTNLPTFEIGQTYTMSFKGTLPSGIYAQLNGFKTSTGKQYSLGSVMRTVPYITFTIDSDYSGTAQLFVGVQGTATNVDCNFAIQIEKGTTATPYEPYTGGIPSPSPDYPQEIRNVTGDVEVVVENKNLFDEENATVLYSNARSTIQSITNGIRVTAGQTSYNAFVTTKICNVSDLIDNKITVKAYWQGTNNGHIEIGYCDIDGLNRVPLSIINTSGNSTSVTIPEGIEDKVIILWFYARGNANGYVNYTNVQVEYGSTATTYTPHKEQVLPLTLGNIELCKIGDYQDYFYKNNGKWYKYNAINKLVLNGSENWSVHGSIASWFYWDGITNGFTDNTIRGYALSNYFTQKAYNTVTSLNNGEFAYGQVAGDTRKRFVIKDTDYTTVADFKTWLSTHNTIVYYVLATPTSTEITDVTLISQLEEISKTLSYQGQTNITSNTIALFDVEAYQSTKLILQNLDSRLTLVEG